MRTERLDRALETLAGLYANLGKLQKKHVKRQFRLIENDIILTLQPDNDEVVDHGSPTEG